MAAWLATLVRLNTIETGDNRHRFKWLIRLYPHVTQKNRRMFDKQSVKQVAFVIIGSKFLVNFQIVMSVESTAMAASQFF